MLLVVGTWCFIEFYVCILWVFTMVVVVFACHYFFDSFLGRNFGSFVQFTVCLALGVRKVSSLVFA